MCKWSQLSFNQKMICTFGTVYLLMLLSPLTLGLTGLLAVFLAIEGTNNLSGTGFERHPAWIVETFGLSVLFYLVALALWFVAIPLSIGVAVVATVWFYARVISGYGYMKIQKSPYYYEH